MIPDSNRLYAFLLLGLLLVSLPATADVKSYLGQAAPDFSLKTLNGNSINLKQLTRRGPVMLVFYETQCVYCFSHIGEFNALHDKYHARGLSIVAINFVGEYIADIRNYARDNGLKYTVTADKLTSIDVAEAYHVVASPTIVVVDSKGRIVFYGYKLPSDVSKWLKQRS